jgi:hypothetical protein
MLSNTTSHEREIKLVINTLKAYLIYLDVKPSDLILTIKENLQEREKITSFGNIRLFYRGQEMLDYHRVSDYDLFDYSTIHFVNMPNYLETETGFEQLLTYQYGNELL